MKKKNPSENLIMRDDLILMCFKKVREGIWDNTVRLDIGCGINTREGYLGIDKDENCNPDIICDFGKNTLPMFGSTVDTIYTSHFLEHLTQDLYVDTMNEFYRVLVPNGTVEIIVPYFRTKVAVQDPTHRMQFCEDSF